MEKQKPSLTTFSAIHLNRNRQSDRKMLETLVRKVKCQKAPKTCYLDMNSVV